MYFFWWQESCFPLTLKQSILEIVDFWPCYFERGALLLLFCLEWFRLRMLPSAGLNVYRRLPLGGGLCEMWLWENALKLVHLHQRPSRHIGCLLFPQDCPSRWLWNPIGSRCIPFAGRAICIFMCRFCVIEEREVANKTRESPCWQ